MTRFTGSVLSAVLLALLLGCGGESNGQTADASPAPVTEREETAPEPQPEPGGDSSQAGTRDYVEGTHYERLPDTAASDSDQIEVIEIFWYGCSHCFDFEPMLKEWARDLEEDVVLKKSPAMWDRQGIMANHARIYYTARALGVLDTIHPAAFRALNVEGEKLRTEEAIADFFVSHGVDREEFTSAFNSFGVDSAVRQAEARQRTYRIQGTPEIIVDGTYRVAARMAGSHQEVLEVTDYLIDRIRNESDSGGE